MIGISGYARSGKDTFGEALVRILKQYGVKAKTYALATQLKYDITFLTEGDFNISAFTKNDDEKKIIRPLLVGYGEAWRKADPDHWIKILNSNFEPLTLPIVTDIRYENEADYILQNQGFLLNINRSISNEEFLGPANEEEKLNGPKVKEKSSFDLCWGTISDQKLIDEIVESFIISVLGDKIELWKATFSS
jgi:hypothetical protein